MTHHTQVLVFVSIAAALSFAGAVMNVINGNYWAACLAGLCGLLFTLVVVDEWRDGP